MKLHEIHYAHQNEHNQPEGMTEEQTRQWNIQSMLAPYLKYGAKVTFNSDGSGSINIEGGQLEIDNCQWRELPPVIKIREIIGGNGIIVRDSKFDSWRGFPEEVEGKVIITGCRFTNLNGFESIPGGNELGLAELNLRNNQLTSLEGAHHYIAGTFDCADNNLSTLEGGPDAVDGPYYCGGNRLTSLKGIASHIGGNLNIEREHHLDTLVGIADMIETINGKFLAPQSKILDGGLGLIQIEGLTAVDFLPGDVADIIQQYLGKPELIFECQNELIEHGYERNAVL